MLKTLKLLVILALACFLVGCGEKGVGSSERAASSDQSKQQIVPEQAITVIDDLGREVTVRSPAKRIVALSPHIVENLFSAQLGDRIVAAVDYSDFPPEALGIPRVGGFADFSVETILSFKPDLVVGWASGYAGFSLLQNKLESLGVALFVDEPKELASIAYSVKRLAILGGTWVENTKNTASSGVTGASVKQRIETFLSDEKVLRERYSDVSNRPKVFYQIWHDPLQTLGGEHVVSSLIELCGGQSIFSDSQLIAPQVNIESVISRDPNLIVFTADDNQTNAIQSFWRQWPAINAVDQQRIFRVNSDWLSRHTLRMMDGVKQLCELIDIARKA